MNGSVLPYDLYWLLMTRYLEPHDALRTARTCKRLWRVFTFSQKRFLEAKMIPYTQFYVSKGIPSRCPVCLAHVETHNLHCHLRKNKCLVNITASDTVQCPQCWHPVKEPRLEAHMLNRCYPLPFGVRKKACRSCCTLVYNNLLESDCTICTEPTYKKPTCPKCYRYCRQCYGPCNGCESFVFTHKQHKCDTELGRLVVALKSYIHLATTLSDGSYVLENQRIVLVDTPSDIPSTMIDHTIVLQRDTFCPILTVSGLLNIWHIAPEEVPHHCRVCINTKQGRFRTCGKCGHARYCSWKCQKMHWHVEHKWACLD